ncbi:TetR/AcrR family transcriptional regulator C-terminal domain-containing protein [Actinoplanes couchii]|uniref:GntR family transcriptional regulator n=1 Tax=Actinoplanes couchii TaxID=403638 RepID=A0ABQ3XET5_9ACTN|nr:TetR/AcrR family transcriptional regulator C-terminal domain-containing protein [Actinoplanes couchii]MDR6319805.1 AcrR family transcriptional regulator [Actinoplanes couchii]GID56940.1 GntR family transcriptional regulator [Actinoplanes couchii]
MAPYLRIAEALAERITAESLRPGDRVPSTRQLMQEFGVAMATATKALAKLRQDGLVHVVPGIGTVVAPRPRRAPAAPVQRESGPDLSTARVVACAVDIADREGMAALSLRRVASELGVAPMTLYGYVANKEQLVLLMSEAAFAQTPPPPHRPADWRTALRDICRLQWVIYRRHPWLVQVTPLTRPRPAPHAMAHTEWALQTIDGIGLDPVTMLHVHLITTSYVRGFAINLEMEAEARQESGITDQEWLHTQQRAVQDMFATGSFPLLARSTEVLGAAFDLDRMFEFGLTRVLDGVGVLIEQRATGRLDADR